MNGVSAERLGPLASASGRCCYVRRTGAMNTLARMILVAVLACASGCARSDWIDATLVTADVTGEWLGFFRSDNQLSYEIRLELEQHGPKVEGVLRTTGAGTNWWPNNSGPIAGTVAGDVFRFRQTNGPLVGEVTVSGDEMAGTVTLRGQAPIVLQRVGSSASRSK